MLRVTTLYACTAATTAEYYTRYLTKADGEQPGVWIGRQADLLGLPIVRPRVTETTVEVQLEEKEKELREARQQIAALEADGRIVRSRRTSRPKTSTPRMDSLIGSPERALSATKVRKGATPTPSTR